MSRSTSTPGRTRRRLILLGVSIVLALGLLEVGARLIGPLEYREPPRSGDRWRETVHRASGIPGLAYELTPDANVEARGIVIKTNAQGMRDDDDVPSMKPPGVRRIAIIGDSYTFGFGVRSRETYPAILEQRLNAAAAPDGPRFDVLNFGVGGYSTRDEALVLQHRALAFSPDVIVVGYVLNDPEIEPIQPLQSHFEPVRWWQHSNVLRRLVKAKRDQDVKRLGDGDYYAYLHAHPEKWASVETAFADMAADSKDAGIPVIVTIFPVTPNSEWDTYRYGDLHAKVAAAAEAAGLEVLDLLPGYEQFPGPELRVSADDAHPNDNGHKIAAATIQNYLRARHPGLFAPSVPSGSSGP